MEIGVFLILESLKAFMYISLFLMQMIVVLALSSFLLFLLFSSVLMIFSNTSKLKK